MLEVDTAVVVQYVVYLTVLKDLGVKHLKPLYHLDFADLALRELWQLGPMKDVVLQTLNYSI